MKYEWRDLLTNIDRDYLMVNGPLCVGRYEGLEIHMLSIDT